MGPKHIDAFPHGVWHLENVWIPMSDGVRLAARIWLPEGAEESPVPAILEYIPYRKRDATAVRDSTRHPYFAGHGYACLRVDMRGAGDSDGLLLDEYLAQERDDALEVLAWIAAQPWCTGAVGMMGISWGGIVCLQTAVRQPPELKAIIPLCASVDRYYDDACYFVGCYPGQTVGWGAVMQGFSTRPPDPLIVGEGWRAQWLERLERTPSFLEIWLNHQRRDDYWLQGTVCTDYEKIRCPVLAIGGWADCWPNTVGRLLENLKVPCKAISGPWGHTYPYVGCPGPAIGFLQEALRWWDCWLKGIDTGVGEEPALRAWINDSETPRAVLPERKGYWVGEPDWPGEGRPAIQLHLGAGTLDEVAPPAAAIPFRSPQTCGLASGEYMPWFASGPGAEMPPDQREDDGKSACFDGPPLEEPLEILGTPYAVLELAADRPAALVAVRLCDVASDGASSLVTFGLLNLAQREGRESPLPVEPNDVYRLSVRLNDTGYRFREGHRLRLAVSSSYWPMAWPTPYPTTLTLYLGKSFVSLPTRAPNALGVEFQPAECSRPLATTQIRPASRSRRLQIDREANRCHYRVEDDFGVLRLDDIGLETESITTQRYSITDDDPLSAEARYSFRFGYARGDWSVRTEGEVTLTCTESAFVLKGRTLAFEGEDKIFDRPMDVRIPRDGF
jgi:putative CocE/NonD family hydrolase